MQGASNLDCLAILSSHDVPDQVMHLSTTVPLSLAFM